MLCTAFVAGLQSSSVKMHHILLSPKPPDNYLNVSKSPHHKSNFCTDAYGNVTLHHVSSNVVFQPFYIFCLMYA